MPETGNAQESWIQGGNRGSQLCGDAAAGADSVTRADADAAGRIYADALQADALGATGHSQAYTAQGAARLRTQEYLLRQQRTISLDLHVDIILDGQRHHVASRQIKIARPHQRSQAGRILQPDGGHASGPVGTRDETPSAGGWLDADLLLGCCADA